MNATIKSLQASEVARTEREAIDTLAQCISVFYGKLVPLVNAELNCSFSSFGECVEYVKSHCEKDRRLLNTRIARAASVLMRKSNDPSFAEEWLAVNRFKASRNGIIHFLRSLPDAQAALTIISKTVQSKKAFVSGMESIFRIVYGDNDSDSSDGGWFEDFDSFDFVVSIFTAQMKQNYRMFILCLFCLQVGGSTDATGSPIPDSGYREGEQKSSLNVHAPVFTPAGVAADKA